MRIISFQILFIILLTDIEFNSSLNSAITNSIIYFLT